MEARFSQPKYYRKITEYAVMAPLVEAAINEAFEESGISQTSQKEVQTWGGKSTIYFNAQSPEQIKIYTLDGICIDEHLLPAGISNVNIAPGTYLVKTEKESSKVVVR